MQNMLGTLGILPSTRSITPASCASSKILIARVKKAPSILKHELLPRVGSRLVLSCFASSCILCCLVLCCLVLRCTVLSCLVLCCLVLYLRAIDPSSTSIIPRQQRETSSVAHTKKEYVRVEGKRERERRGEVWLQNK